MSGEKKSVDESSTSEDELEQGKAVPRNLVEVETSSNKWKTEFENEISSIRINGEEVTKLHQAVTDLRKLREKSKNITGLALTDTLKNYAQTGSEYTKILNQIIKQNNLSDFEPVRLVNSVKQVELNS